jgi:hemoglobin
MFAQCRFSSQTRGGHYLPIVRPPVLSSVMRARRAAGSAYRSAVAVAGASRHRKRKRSLYERLGGIYAIAAVVNEFSNALIRNRLVGVGSPNPFLDKWSRKEAPKRLAGLKWMRTLWVCAVAGGPYEFKPSTRERKGKCPFSLENAHRQLAISPQEFDEVARVLAQTLDRFKIKNPERAEVLAAFAAHKPDVNHGYFIANTESAPPIKC